MMRLRLSVSPTQGERTRRGMPTTMTIMITSSVEFWRPFAALFWAGCFNSNYGSEAGQWMGRHGWCIYVAFHLAHIFYDYRSFHMRMHNYTHLSTVDPMLMLCLMFWDA